MKVKAPKIAVRDTGKRKWHFLSPRRTAFYAGVETTVCGIIGYTETKNGPEPSFPQRCAVRKVEVHDVCQQCMGPLEAIDNA